MASVKHSTSVGVFGFGNVGRELCRQVNAVGMRVGLVADSSCVLVSSSIKGFSPQTLAALAEAKAAGTPLSQAQGNFTSHKDAKAAFEVFRTHNNPVVADCSAYSSPEDYLLPALSLGMPVALANKKPFTGKFEWYESLMAQPNLIGIEATCGAGLPVIISTDRLLDSGDVITKIEGQLSGTLGYILSELEAGRKFSEIVVEAVAAGYAEPDPRDDLSGTDVARKALILARKIAGNSFGGLDQIAVEALYPESMAKLSVPEFIEQLPTLDETFEAKIKQCNATGTKLRYCATVEPGQQIKVGLKEVPAGSPLAGLKGTDNLVSFTSTYYDTNPLVVVGPGAGLSVTAGSVLADIAMLCHKNIPPKL